MMTERYVQLRSETRIYKGILLIFAPLTTVMMPQVLKRICC